MLQTLMFIPNGLLKIFDMCKAIILDIHYHITDYIQEDIHWSTVFI